MPSEHIPDEIWEAARALRGAVLWESNSSVEHIASALMARDKRAAEIANRAEAWHTREVIAAAILTYGGRDG